MDLKSFEIQILPQLVFHYCREALKDLEGKCQWLKTFTSTQPDWNEARDHFFRDGSGCIHDLEKYIELVRIERANKELTRILGVEYILFMAELDAAGLSGSMAIGRRSAAESGLLDQILMMQSSSEDMNTVASIKSFLTAAEETIVDHQAQGADGE